jgi:hypothetical protein
MAKELQERETLGTDEIFKLILTHLDSDERALVESKYERAKEMRFEHSSEISEPTELKAETQEQDMDDTENE